MAVTQKDYVRNGIVTNYTFDFPYLNKADVKVRVNGTVVATTEYSFANATTIAMGSAGTSGDKLVIFRDTDNDSKKATFYAGSAIKAEDLNDNYDQILYVAQEIDNNAMTTDGTTVMTADFPLGEDVNITFEGATDNAFETTLTVIDPTADRTVSLPNVTGTLVSTGDTGTVTSTMIADATIVNGDIANTTITGGKLVNDTITATQIAANAVTASELADDAVDRNAIVNDAVNGTKIADDSIDSEHYVDGSIDAIHIANNTITATQLAADSVGTSELANDSVASANIIDGSILNADINASAGIVGSKLANDTITATQIATNAVTASELADDAVDQAAIAANAVNGSKIAANSIDSDHYVDGSIDRIHLEADIIDGTKIADSSINSEHYADGSIDHEHLANDIIDGDNIQDNAIGSEHIAANAVTTSEIADAELTTLAGMQSGTASILAGGTALTSTLSELNLLDGKSIVTTISNPTDVQLPTAQAVEERIVDLVTDVGGFRPIANETSFPTTNPDPEDDAGTIVSVKALASNLTSNGSGVATIANGAGSGNTVTITGMANSDTIEAGKGILVETTSTLHTYTFHRETLAPSDVADAKTAVDDFNQRYQVASSTPSNQPDGTALAEGDLFFDTTANKMKVYDGSNYGEVTSTGDFKYLFLCPAGGTGAPTLNGSIATYDLRESSNSGSAASVTSAAQLLVSINGVVQKANTGTSAPAEGFALVDANTIIFGANLASGDSVFIVQVGSAVSIPTPGDNTVSTVKIQNLAVDNSKIANDTIAEAKLDIHQAPADGKFLKYTSSNGMEWGDVPAGVGGATGVDFNDSILARWGTDNDLSITHNNANGKIKNETGFLQLCSNEFSIGNEGNTEMMLTAYQNGAVELYYDNSKKLNTQGSGITVTGGVYSDGLVCGDGDKIELGDAAELKIWHDGNTHSYITEAGGGGLAIGGSMISLMNLATTEYMLKGTADGSVELYHNNVKKCETTSAGVTITGDLTVTGSAPGGTSTGETYVKLSDADGTANNSGQVTSGGSGAGTQGNESTYYGYQAGGSSTGGGNCLIGGKAGDSMGAGGSNTALGQDALKSCNSANFNTALGKSALQNCTVSNNTAVGARAGDAATSANDCIFIGWDAGGGITEGDYNIAIGNECLMAATTGSANVNVGRDGLRAITSGSKNVSIGNDANRTCQTGNYNISVGHEALFNNTASNNVAVGYQALKANTSGASNTAVGNKAGDSIQGGGDNVCIGAASGQANVSGIRNTACGTNAASQNTGSYITAFGYNACQSNTSGGQNTAVGYLALQENSTNSGNTGIGFNALMLSTGGNNTGVGAYAGSAINSGYSNTSVGLYAGDTTQSGYANVALGMNADHGGTSHYREIVIGCDGTGKGSNTAYIHASSGCYQQDNTTSWSTTSDERLKKNITDNTVGLSVIDKLKVRNFEYRTKDEVDYSEFTTGTTKESVYINKTGTQIGIIAQELEAICPGCVTTIDTGVKTVNTDELFWHMINAIKELSTKVKALEAA